MHLSLDNIACVVGMLFMFAGLVGAWVETRLKVRTNMRDIETLQTKHRECRKQQMARGDELLNTVHMLRQEFTERLGEINTNTAQTAQKLDDFIAWSKKNGNGGKHA